MSTVPERLPEAEARRRQERCRALLAERLPEAGGMLVFSSINIYYLSGSLATGVFWLPLEGEPVLLVRQGIERVRMESPLERILPYRSYGELADACAGAGSPITPIAAAEKNGLNWSGSELLKIKMKDMRFMDAAPVLARARSVKSAWELAKMREAGARHRASYEALADRLRPGMTERETAAALWTEFMAREHALVFRSSGAGEPSLGQFSVGDNSNYPNAWDGTVGGPGGHATAPYMGSPGTVWKRNSLLTVDICFNYEGYHTDATQVFWSGKAADIPDEVRRAQDACVAIYDHAVELLRPGNTPEQVWRESLAMAERAGHADVWMGNSESRARFVGHGIGLTYDEFPALADRFTEPFQAGMTIALEPKMALQGHGMVGLEHILEISEDGARSITGEQRDIVSVDD